MVSNKNKLRIGDYEQFIFSWGNVISCLWNYSDIASRQRVPTDKRNKRSFSARIIMFCSKDSWDVHKIRYLRDPKYFSSRFSFTYKLDSRSMSAKENYAFIFNAILREISSARDNRIMAPRVTLYHREDTATIWYVDGVVQDLKVLEICRFKGNFKNIYSIWREEQEPGCSILYLRPERVPSTNIDTRWVFGTM